MALQATFKKEHDGLKPRQRGMDLQAEFSGAKLNEFPFSPVVTRTGVRQQGNTVSVWNSHGEVEVLTKKTAERNAVMCLQDADRPIHEHADAAVLLASVNMDRLKAMGIDGEKLGELRQFSPAMRKFQTGKNADHSK